VNNNKLKQQADLTDPHLHQTWVEELEEEEVEDKFPDSKPCVEEVESDRFNII